MKLPPQNPSADPHDFSFGVDAALGFDAIRSAFEKKFPDEDYCWKWLFQYAKSGGLLKCRCCGKQYTGRIRKLRAFVCAFCGKTTWITKGTLFVHVRKLRAWLAAIWFTEHGIVVSSLWLSRFAGIAQSSALNILRRLRIILEDYMDEAPKLIETGRFTDIMLRRSRLTPAACHPRSEESEMRKKRCDAERAASRQESAGSDAESDSSAFKPTHDADKQDPADDSQSSPEIDASDLGAADEVGPRAASSDENFVWSERGREIYDLLERRSMTFDELSDELGLGAEEMSRELTALEVQGLIINVGGGRYKRTSAARELSRLEPKGARMSTAEKIPTLSDIVEFVRFHFHGVSRKYLQMYAVARWCFETKERWRGGNLLNACWRADYITYDEIMAYVTPFFVKVDAD